MDLHGKLIPVLSVRARLQIADRPVSVDDQFIIARTSRRTVALVVDRVEDVVACAPSSIVAPEKIVAGWEHTEGVMHVESGLILIYDLDRFLSLQEDEVLEHALKGQVRDGH
jgi:purine-binding chemotaxis protein CheW